MLLRTVDSARDLLADYYELRFRNQGINYALQAVAPTSSTKL